MSKMFNIGTNDLDTPVQGPLFHSIEYELNGIVEKINNIDNFNEKELKNIIIRQHEMILNFDNFLSSKDTREKALVLFTNKKFLLCFLDVIRILNISDHEKICLNKIAFDYYILPNKDQEISDLLYQLTTEVNGKELVVLSGILGRKDAQILSMIRNSSFKEEKVVDRINDFLLYYPKELSIKELASIYCNLFRHVTVLFTQTMIGRKPENLTPEQSKRYDDISIVLLEIIDSMPSCEIKKVMTSYIYKLNRISGNIYVRFSIKSAIRYANNTDNSGYVYRYERIIKIAKEVDFEYANEFKIKIP